VEQRFDPVTLEILWRRPSGPWQQVNVPGDSTSVYLVGANDGDRIVIEARARNGLGKLGPSTFVAHTVSGTASVTDTDYTVVPLNTISLGLGSPGTGTAYVLTQTYVNPYSRSVVVELSSALNGTATAVAGGWIDVNYCKLVADLYTTSGGTFVSSHGEQNAQAPIPRVTGAGSATWSHSRVLLVTVPADHELRTHIEVDHDWMAASGGTAIALRDFSLRITTIKA